MVADWVVVKVVPKAAESVADLVALLGRLWVCQKAAVSVAQMVAHSAGQSDVVSAAASVVGSGVRSESKSELQLETRYRYR